MSSPSSDTFSSMSLASSETFSYMSSPSSETFSSMSLTSSETFSNMSSPSSKSFSSMSLVSSETECSKCSKCWIKVRHPYRVLFYLKSPIFILQRAYIPKNGVEFCQQINVDNRSSVATLYDLIRRRQKYSCTYSITVTTS